MGTPLWLSCWWHWKMKAISELAELWGGLRRSSIWAPGLLLHSLASLKLLEWARLKYKQEHQEENQAGTRGCRISSVDTLVNTLKHTRTHTHKGWVIGWWLVACGCCCKALHASGPAQADNHLWWTNQKSGRGNLKWVFCTNTSGIAISLHSASLFKFTFMSFEARF